MSIAFDGTAPKGPITPLPWIGAIFVAVLGIAQQFCLIGKTLKSKAKKNPSHDFLFLAALKSGSATKVAMIRSFQIVLSFIMQVSYCSTLTAEIVHYFNFRSL